MRATLVLKDKLRCLKIFKSLFERVWCELSSTKSKGVRSAQPTEARGEVFIQKMRKQVKKLSDWLELKQLPYLGKSVELFMIV